LLIAICQIIDFLCNKAERRGIFILSFIVVLLLLYNVFGPFNKNKVSDFSEFENRITKYESVKDSLALLNKPQKTPNKKYYSKTKRTYHFKSFNPNTISKNDWISMGLTSKQASSIIKFVSKGGKFYKPDDIRKLYCLSSVECDMIVPYVAIEDTVIQKDISYVHKKEYLQIELNSATQESLELVNGIGPSIAKGILKYRNILGGYVQIEQLKEVYHIDSAKYENLKNNFTLNMDSINRININTADYYIIKRHPYISKQIAYEIVRYRNQKGNYRKIEDILEIEGISDSLYKKIYLYFALSEQK